MTTATALTVPPRIDLDEEAVNPTVAYALWFNARPTIEGVVATGLHLPVGNEQVDSLGAQLKWPQYTVIHSDGVEKLYWRATPCSLIFVALNTQSKAEMEKTDGRKGIVAAWGPVLDKKTRQFKINEETGKQATAHRVRAKIFILELARLGYYEPFLFAARGRITDSVLSAANATYRITRALTEYRRREEGDKAAKVYFYSAAVPIDAASKPQKAGESTIYPVVTKLPTSLDENFLLRQETPLALVESIRESGLLAQTIEWSTEESRLIRLGKHPEQLPPVQVAEEREPGEEDGVIEADVREMPSTPPAASAQRPASIRAARSTAPVTEEEEAEAFAALFEEEPEEARFQQELQALKAEFAQLYPSFSQSPGWWNTTLDRIFPGRWESAASINEADLTLDDLPTIRQKLKAMRASLQAKRAASGKGKTTRS